MHNRPGFDPLFGSMEQIFYRSVKLTCSMGIVALYLDIIGFVICDDAQARDR